MSDTEIATILAHLKDIKEEIGWLREWKHATSNMVTTHEAVIMNNTKRLDKLIEDHNEQMANGGCKQEVTITPTVQRSLTQAILHPTLPILVAGGMLITLLLIAKSMGWTF